MFGKKAVFGCLAVAVVCSLAVELLVCNYRSVDHCCCPGGGIKVDVAGAVLSADAPEVEFSGLDAAVANVRLSLDSNTESRIGIYVKDEGNSQWYSMPSAVAVGAGEGDYYARLHLAGRMTAVKFALLDGEDAEICFDGLDFNVAQPFAVSWKRLIVFAAAFAFVFAFRPRSSAYCIPFSSCKKLVIAFACLQVGAVLVLGVVSPYGRAVQNLDNHRQYYDLAVSLSKGQVFLDEEPSSQLMGMDNPYDRQARDAEGVSYHWDRAYYEGKYYVYFGVMPALVFHLPYYLVTGALSRIGLASFCVVQPLWRVWPSFYGRCARDGSDSRRSARSFWRISCWFPVAGSSTPTIIRTCIACPSLLVWHVLSGGCRFGSRPRPP